MSLLYSLYNIRSLRQTQFKNTKLYIYYYGPFCGLLSIYIQLKEHGETIHC
jgi:hypothetical protein